MKYTKLKYKTREPIADMIGKTFGSLRVLYDTGERSGTIVKFMCRCVCGTEKAMFAGNLRSGKIQTCGCSRRKPEHHTTEYRTWKAMLARCTNPNATGYENYGGRGIKVCSRWLVFSKFLADMGLKPGPNYSIERRDNDGPYIKRNCYWATRQQNNDNRRVTRRLTYIGETKTLMEWAKAYGLSYYQLHGRLARGWTISEALNT